MALKTAFSLQVNVVVGSVSFNKEVGRFSDIVVPLLHFKMRLGMVLKTAFSLQVNVVVRSVSFNKEVGRFSDIVVPLLQFKMVQPEMTDQNKYDLKLMYIIVPYSLWAVEALLFISGFILMAYSVQLFLANWIYSRAIVFQAPESGKTPIAPSAVPLLL